MGTSSKLGVARRSWMAWLSGFSAAIFAMLFSRYALEAQLEPQLFHRDFRVSQNARRA
jgi:hypothetical protein